jgi:hypothetical protein
MILKKLTGFFLSILSALMLVLHPVLASGAELDLIRESMKDLGLYNGKKRPKISTVYASSRSDLKPKAQNWLDPIVDSVKNYPVPEIISKVAKNRENQDVYRFIFKDPNGAITVELTPDSESQPLKVNGVPMPVAAWWSEEDFEIFIDTVILDGQLDASQIQLNKFQFLAQLLIGQNAWASEADDLWFEVIARACLALSETADPLCDKVDGALEVLSRGNGAESLKKLSEAKENILAERSEQKKEQDRLSGLIRHQYSKLEKTLKQPKKLPEKKIASQVEPLKNNMPEAVGAVSVASKSPPVKAKSAKKSTSKPSHKKVSQKSKSRKSNAAKKQATPKVLTMDFADIEEDLEKSEAEITAGQRHQITARELASLTELADDQAIQADVAAKVPAPVVDSNEDEKSKPFAQRTKKMTSKKVGMAVATITGMSLLTKVVSKKARQPVQLAQPEKDNAPSVVLTREPASVKAAPKKVEAETVKVEAESPFLSPQQLMTPVKPRKNRGTN